MSSDEALFERWRRGEVAAFDQLYARYERPLFAFIRRSLSDRAEAEDVLHETFIAALKGQGRFVSVRAWLYRTANHACLNRARALRRAVVPPAPEAALEASVELEKHEQAGALSRAVAALPTALGQLYQLRANGLSYQELAQVLEVPLGTVKSRMHELLSRLRQEMK